MWKLFTLQSTEQTWYDFYWASCASRKDTHVHGCLQVVDTAKFTQNGTRGTDFDVNNLKLSTAGLEIKNSKTVFAQGLHISSILQHIRSKSLWILEPPLTLTGRIAKMQRRGWRILNQYPWQQLNAFVVLPHVMLWADKSSTSILQCCVIRSDLHGFSVIFIFCRHVCTKQRACIFCQNGICASRDTVVTDVWKDCVCTQMMGTTTCNCCTSYIHKFDFKKLYPEICISAWMRSGFTKCLYVHMEISLSPSSLFTWAPLLKQTNHQSYCGQILLQWNICCGAHNL